MPNVHTIRAVCLTALFLAVSLALIACRAATPPEPMSPSVRFLSPADGASLPLGEELILEADSSGRVARVAYTLRDQELASVSAPPYRYSFTPEAAGEYRFVVTAHSETGAVSEPATATVTLIAAERLYSLAASVSGPGRLLSDPAGLECLDTCQASFRVGEPLTLTARPDAGANFAGWGGACADTAGPTCTLTPEAATPLSVSATFTPAPTSPASFAIVVLPDTQNFLCSRCTHPARAWEPEVFEAQTQWAVDNREARNIAFVTHVGDVLECANYGVSVNGLPCNTDGKDEWAAADKAIAILDGHLPYSVAIGDHEYFPEQYHSADYANYVRHFGADRYAGYDWYGGAGPRELSHYQLFGAGGYTFLHIALEWEAPDDTLAWAQRVIGEHPGKPTIVTIHGYLDDGLYSGDRTCGERTCTPVPASDTRNYRQRVPESYDCPGSACVANAPEDIFQRFIRPNPQIFMVLGGHHHGPGGIRYFHPPSNIGELHQVSLNAAGLPVFEMLANYQAYTKSQGFMRIITFKPGGGEGGQDRIFVETYSPYLDAYQRDDMGTRSASEFHFDLDFGARFSAGAP
jgi:hypothetical protein